MSCKHKLLFILFFCAFGCFAQDIIIQKNGSRIYCRIQREDSVNIYYSLPNRKTQLAIEKVNVYKYEIFAPKKPKVDTSGHKEFSEILLFNLSGGIANPVGDFASKDANSILSGLATTGYIFHQSAILKLSPYFGFSLAYRYQTHRFLHEYVTQQYRAAFPGWRCSGTGTNWIIKGFFAGIHLSVPIKNIPHLSINADISIGLPKYVYPEYMVRVDSARYAFTITQDISVTTAPTFLGGLGLTYRVHKNVAFSLSLSYLQSRAYFSRIYSHTSYGAFRYDDYNQKIATYNFHFGLTFLIFRPKK